MKDNVKMKQSILLCALIAVLMAVLLFSSAVAAPILCRPFYYAHIDQLELETRTGLTEDEIKAAFNEMMDYCLGGTEFSTGVLKWSESGKSHFTDVRGLFLLDLRVLGISAIALVITLMFAQYARRPLGRGPSFWAGVGLGGSFLLVGGLSALDFDRAFVVFHSLFFSGKDNWRFDQEVDQIIKILPQEYFRNCAILILVLLMAGCIALVVLDLHCGKRNKVAKKPMLQS